MSSSVSNLVTFLPLGPGQRPLAAVGTSYKACYLSMTQIADIANNLLASALWDLLVHPAYRGAVGLVSARTLTQKRRLAKAIDSAAEVSAGSHVQFGVAEPAWRDFLASAQAHELITDVFAYQLANHATADELHIAFEVLWAEFAEPRMLSSKLDVARVIERLTHLTQRLLDRAIQDGVLEAHEAKSAARHRIIEDRLSQLDRRLTMPAILTEPEALTYAAHLRQAVRERHSTIEPPSLQIRERVPISDLYVAPTLTLQSGSDSSALTFDQFVATTRRRVVLDIRVPVSPH